MEGEGAEGFRSHEVGRIRELHFAAARVTIEPLQALPWVALTALTTTARHHPSTHAAR